MLQVVGSCLQSGDSSSLRKTSKNSGFRRKFSFRISSGKTDDLLSKLILDSQESVLLPTSVNKTVNFDFMLEIVARYSLKTFFTLRLLDHALFSNPFGALMNSLRIQASGGYDGRNGPSLKFFKIKKKFFQNQESFQVSRIKLKITMNCN